MQRVGLLGSGVMATTHANSYATIGDAEVVAVASTGDNLDEFVDEHTPDGTAYDDPETMLDEADITILDVCTPTPTHHDYATAGAERGLAVFCEKPMTRTMAEADSLVATVEETGVPFMVGHVLRFFPSYLTAKDRIDAGELGQLGTMRAERLSPPPKYGSDNWFSDVEQSGGVLLDMAIHDFDYLRWIVGDVERVFTRSTTWTSEEGHRHEHAGVDLRFADGTAGYVEASWAYPDQMDFTTGFEFAGDEGSLEYDTRDEHPVRFTGDTGGEMDPAAGAFRVSPYTRELRHFVECVESGTDPAVGAHEAREAVRIALAAIASGERGEPVTVSEVTA
ncbi:gfo/Idh/MocA family oxidoreductase [Halobacteriales archaeon QS_4_62_28]|nr:MAG: gfo/Idh/MocA family oxidoreductase [Halobacteriales archaeon QS_4_62_28]